MINIRLQGLTTCLWVSLVCSIGSTASAQTSAGESANFSSFMGEVDADLEMIEPACTNCGTLVVEEASKGGAAATPSAVSMEDETTLEFSAERPDSVSGGPDPVISSIDDEMDGLDYEMTTVDEGTKAAPFKFIRKTKVKLKVKPAKRGKFPTVGMAEACDPAKPYKKTQLGWRTVRIASVAKKKAGRTIVSKGRTVKVCVRNPPEPPKTCGLSCGQGSCQQQYLGGKWSATCSCKAGYTFDGSTCSDIDECKSGARCAADRTCKNTTGSFECACGPGTVATATGCRKLTPCEVLQCQKGLVCKTNSVGASCGCQNPGEVLVNGVCKPTRVCAANSCGGGAAVKCVDNSIDSKVAPGEYRCDCPAGAAYLGSGRLGRCMDINECALPNVTSLCRTNLCRNMDAMSSPSTPGAMCGPEKLPRAPSIKAVFDLKTKSWQ